MAKILKTYSDLVCVSNKSHSNVSKLTISTQLIRRPITMAIISTGALSFVGDIACQYIEHSLSDIENKKYKWNVKRSIRFGGVGMLLGPQLSFWYSTLATKIFIGETFSIALKRMCLDQSAFAPWCICFVFTLNTHIDGGNFTDSKNRIKDQFLTTYKVNLMVWPMTQLINFWLIPPQFRVLIANFVALWWNTYLSYRSHVTLTHNI
eukprot:546244_1